MAVETGSFAKAPEGDQTFEAEQSGQSEESGARADRHTLLGRLRRRSLLLAVFSGLAAYGLVLDESVRPDPFTAPSGISDWFAYRPSHDALTTMPVVPIGTSGVLTLRPTNPSLMNSPEVSGLPIDARPSTSMGLEGEIGTESQRQISLIPAGEARERQVLQAEIDLLQMEVLAARVQLVDALATADDPPTEDQRGQIEEAQALLNSLITRSDALTTVSNRPQTLSPPLPINLARFSSDGVSGWISAGDIGLHSTNDGGMTWRHRTPGLESTIVFFDIVPETRCGWALDSSGTEYSSNDGGLSWSTGFDPFPCLPTTFAESRLFRDWINALVSNSPIQGERPQTISLSSEPLMLSLLPFDTPEPFLLVADADGSVREPTADETPKDMGHPFSPAPGEAEGPSFRAWLAGVRLESGFRTGWAVGDQGILVSVQLPPSDSGGAPVWQQHQTPTTATLRSIYFQRGDRIGWASSGWHDSELDGGRPVILQTMDGGETWEQLHYGRGPAGWVLLIALPGLAFALYGVGATAFDLRNAPEPQRSIADDAETDAPIGWEDRDALGLKPIARALSKFVRNSNTDPPLTFAVTGQWGSGKSSLINLVAEDLRYFDARPVWFNAWHHQRERHLLAALLENIRDQAIPPWWRGSGLAFRLRLLLRRSKKSLAGLLATAVFVAMVAFAIGLSHSESLPTLVRATVQSAGSLAESWFELATGKQDQTVATTMETEAGDGPAAPDIGDVEIVDRLLALFAGLGTMGAALVAVIAVLRRLRVLKLDPAKLMTTLTERTKVGAFRDQLSFRHKFGEEFKDVCLELRTARSPGMVIMIDDLDRCRPENVLEILEAVNFLVTVAPCFIFLGIDEEKVINAVAYGFKDSILELPRNGRQMRPNRTYLEPDPQALAEFSEAYLEKLINIVVPVPTPTAETAERILRAEDGQNNTHEEESRDQHEGESNAVSADRPSSDGKAPVSPWPRHVRRILRSAIDCVAGLAPLTLAGYLMVFVALQAFPREPDALPHPSQAQAGSPEATAPNPALSSESASGAPETATQPPSNYPEVASDAVTDRFGWESWGFLALSLIVISTLAAGRMFSVREAEVSDSRDFGKAVALWSPVVYAANPTPRGVKRFKNRLRYFAMRLRGDDRPLDWIDRAFARYGVKVREAQDDKLSDIDEATLITIGALDALDPELLSQPADSRTRLMAAEIGRRQADQGLQLGADWSAESLVGEFVQKFPDAWDFGEEEVRRYRLLNRTIQG